MSKLLAKILGNAGGGVLEKISNVADKFITTKEVIHFENLEKSCLYKLAVTSINAKYDLTAGNVYFKFTTKSSGKCLFKSNCSFLTASNDLFL